MCAHSLADKPADCSASGGVLFSLGMGIVAAESGTACDVRTVSGFGARVKTFVQVLETLCASLRIGSCVHNDFIATRACAREKFRSYRTALSLAVGSGDSWVPGFRWSQIVR